MQFVLKPTPAPVAMHATVGFGVLRSEMDKDGAANHTLSVFSVCQHRAPSTTNQTRGDAKGRNDGTILGRTIRAKDDGARLFIIQLRHNSGYDC